MISIHNMGMSNLVICISLTILSVFVFIPAEAILQGDQFHCTDNEQEEWKFYLTQTKSLQAQFEMVEITRGEELAIKWWNEFLENSEGGTIWKESRECIKNLGYDPESAASIYLDVKPFSSQKEQFDGEDLTNISILDSPRSEIPVIVDGYPNPKEWKDSKTYQIKDQEKIIKISLKNTKDFLYILKQYSNNHQNDLPGYFYHYFCFEGFVSGNNDQKFVCSYHGDKMDSGLLLGDFRLGTLEPFWEWNDEKGMRKLHKPDTLQIKSKLLGFTDFSYIVEYQIPIELFSKDTVEKLMFTVVKGKIENGTNVNKMSFEWPTDAVLGNPNSYGKLRLSSDVGIFGSGMLSNEDDSNKPEWIKNNARLWSERNIGDSEFLSGLEYLIKEGILDIPQINESNQLSENKQIPPWVRNNADWWSRDLISEDEFVGAIQYLIQQGIIVV